MDKKQKEQEKLRKIAEKPWLLGQYKEENITREMCMAAVKQDGLVLQFVPQNLLTQEICITAVKQNGRALYYVPKTIRKKIAS